jgi:NAD(P) transhydrogenase subunit alpha
LHFLDEMGGATGWKIDHENDAVRPALVLESGEKRWPAPPMKKAEAPAAPAAKKESAEPSKPAAQPPGGPAHAAPTHRPGHSHHHGPPGDAPSKSSGTILAILGLVLAGLWAYLRFGQGGALENADPATLKLFQHVTVFVMAIFVGFQVVWNVTPALHTPLMSVTNAISGIIVVGGLLASAHRFDTSAWIALVATLFAAINIAGGFLVTRRMLAMFRK